MPQKSRGRPRSIDPTQVALVATAIFEERGFDVTTMDDVATAGEVSRRRLFQLYPTKAALVLAGFDNYLERFRRSLAGASSSVPAEEAVAQAYIDASTFPAREVEITARRLRIMTAYPTVFGGGPHHSTELVEEALDYISAKDHVDRFDLSLSVRVHAQAAGVSAALKWWAHHSTDPPEAVVTAALGRL